MTDDPLAATVTATVTFTEPAPPGPSAAVAAELRELVELAGFVTHACHGLALPADRRRHLAGGCLELALEYQAAIATLSAGSQWSGVHALYASLLEAFARGVWLARCADAQSLAGFERGGLAAGDERAGLLAEVERALPLVARTRAQLGLAAWDGDTDRAHAGSAHLERRGRAAGGEPPYADAELIRALRASAALGVLAGIELAAVAGRRDLAEALRQRLDQFATAAAAP